MLELTLRKCQEEMKPWQAHNFPDRPQWLPLTGAWEEYGELVEHNYQGDIPEILDALGDITIYLCDFANGQNLDLADLANAHSHDSFEQSPMDGIAINLGRASHAFIKTFQNIRMHEGHAEKLKIALGNVIVLLDMECTNWNTTLDFVLSHTWAKVKQRDWQKNRETAHKV